jgi:predicted aspartyl protease
MRISFQHRSGLIIVDAQVDGPTAQGRIRLALDTGATFSLLNASALVIAGYDPAITTERFEITTASGVEYAAQIKLHRLAALGIEKIDFPVLTHTLPPSAGIDGLLGLDLFRGLNLQIDFRTGFLSVG